MLPYKYKGYNLKKEITLSEKSRISKLFYSLNNNQFIVYIFQSNQKTFGNFQGMSDILVIDKVKPFIMFGEIKSKSTNDSMKIQKSRKPLSALTLAKQNKHNVKVQKQIALQNAINLFETDSIRHFILSEDNYKNIFSLVSLRQYNLLSKII